MWDNIIAAILLFNVESSMPSWLHQETLLRFRRDPQWTQLEPAYYRAKKAKDENDFGGNAETWCQLQRLQGEVPSIYSNDTQWTIGPTNPLSRRRRKLATCPDLWSGRQVPPLNFATNSEHGAIAALGQYRKRSSNVAEEAVARGHVKRRCGSEDDVHFAVGQFEQWPLLHYCRIKRMTAAPTANASGIVLPVSV
jgi:hypothetical protein